MNHNPQSEIRNPQCSLLCVGSELLRGKINTHASTLARRLAAVGIDLAEERTIGDDQDLLAAAIREALSAYAIVMVTGGLGPTFDDVTREAAAAATGRRLMASVSLLRELRQKFRKARYRRMPPANARQAQLLDGAQVIPNSVGTAPGQWLTLKTPSPRAGEAATQRAASPAVWRGRDGGRVGGEGNRLLILLPGPPAELLPMLDQFVVPRLAKTFPAGGRAEAHLHFVGVPESVVDHKIRPIIRRASAARARSSASVDFTILAHLGLVDFDIFVSDRSQVLARRRLAPLVRKVRSAMGRAFYGMDKEYPLEKVVGRFFIQKRQTLAAAESCTGGYLSKRLTDIPGSSAYFLGGTVSYDNRVKISALGVPPDLLGRHGAVSRQVAAAMANGIRKRFGADWGISITGVAGPSGGTPVKPVGLVYIALAGPKGTRVREYRFRGSRDAIRHRTVIAALDLLRQIYL